MPNVFMKEQVIIITVCQYETKRCDNACLEHISTNQPGTLEVFMEWKFETLFIDNPFMLNITTCNAKHTCYVVTFSVKHCEQKKSSLTTKHLLT